MAIIAGRDRGIYLCDYDHFLVIDDGGGFVLEVDCVDNFDASDLRALLAAMLAAEVPPYDGSDYDAELKAAMKVWMSNAIQEVGPLVTSDDPRVLLGAVALLIDRAAGFRGRLCQSPIELSLYRAMRAIRLNPQPQARIGPYAADFLVGDLVIECDGHDYHSTKEQRTHDARRDRYLQLHGYQVARFTGTEIHRDPDACAAQVAQLVEAGRARLRRGAR